MWGMVKQPSFTSKVGLQMKSYKFISLLCTLQEAFFKQINDMKCENVMPTWCEVMLYNQPDLLAHPLTFLLFDNRFCDVEPNHFSKILYSNNLTCSNINIVCIMFTSCRWWSGDLKTVSAMFALILGDDDPISLANIGYTTIRSFVWFHRFFPSAIWELSHLRDGYL